MPQKWFHRAKVFPQAISLPCQKTVPKNTVFCPTNSPQHIRHTSRSVQRWRRRNGRIFTDLRMRAVIPSGIIPVLRHSRKTPPVTNGTCGVRQLVAVRCGFSLRVVTRCTALSATWRGWWSRRAAVTKLRITAVASVSPPKLISELMM